MNREHGLECDVCIVGSGASGCVAAERLCRAGLRVAIIEQGQGVDGASGYDSIISASEPAMCRLDNGAWGPVGYPWTSCNVGGGTVFYGGVSFRLREVDFAASRFVPGCDLSVDWPIDYEALRPYYDAIELVLGLAGDPVASDPTHPGGASPVMPGVAQSPQGRRLQAAGDMLGLSPFRTPLMIATEPYRGRPACGFSSPCIEHLCTSGARADPFRILVQPLLSGSLLSIHPHQKAVRLLPSPDGRRAVSLETVDMRTGVRTEWRAHTFVVAANAIQTAALLLRSRQEKGGGLQISPLLGAGLCMKLNEYVVGYLTEPEVPMLTNDPWREGVGPVSTVATTRYYLDAACPAGMGGIVYEARYGWRYGNDPSTDAARLECLIADTPSRQNCVRLSKTTDKFGIPLVAIDYRTNPRDRARLEWLVSRAQDWLQAAGYGLVWREPGGYALGSSHLHGTCRAGIDSSTSVVNPEGRLHHVENVYVADGSYMPFPGAVNPTLTIQAVALMVADRLSRTLTGPDGNTEAKI